MATRGVAAAPAPTRRSSSRSAAKGAVQYNHSQKAPRAAAGQPSDCKTLTDWARRIALAFEDDLEAGMQKYRGVLKDAVEVDGFPLTSLPTLYKMHEELLAVRGVVATSSCKGSRKGSSKGSPAAAKPAAVEPVAAPQKKQRKGVEPVESAERKAERLLATMGAEAAQQPAAAANSPFKGTADAPAQPRRSKRARRPTTIAHAKLGGGSI